MAAPTPQVHEIDISKHAKAFNFATMANYVVAYVCLNMAAYVAYVAIVYVTLPLIAPTLFEGIQTEHFLFIYILSAPLCAFCALGILRDTGKIDDAAFHRLSRVYPVSILASSPIALMSLGWEMKAALLSSCVCAIVGLVFVRRLRRSPIPAIHVSAADLAARTRGDKIALLSESIGSTKIKKSNAPLAVVLILVGLLGIVYHWISAGNLLFILWMDLSFEELDRGLEELRSASPEELARPFEERYRLSDWDWLLNFAMLSSIIEPFAGMAGFALLLRARRHLQISADAMLAVDSRGPVVFLRAFEDEERPNYRQSQKALIDFSLETRLAEHVRYVGPFVAGLFSSL